MSGALKAQGGPGNQVTTGADLLAEGRKRKTLLLGQSRILKQAFQKDISIHSKPTCEMELQSHLFVEELGRGGKERQRGEEGRDKRDGIG